MPTFTLRKAPPSRIPSVTVTAPDLDSALRGVMGTVMRSNSIFRVPEVTTVRADEIIPGDLIVHRRHRVSDRVFRVEDLTDLPGEVRLTLTDFHSASGRQGDPGESRFYHYPVKADAPVLIATREGAG